MKKTLWAVFIGLLLGGFGIADVNPVTFPTPGYRLCMGKTCEIRWDKGYFQEEGVKIVLYTGTRQRIKVLTITPNNGAWRWTVPTNLAEGDYLLYIRGSGPDTAPQHFGPVFKIRNCRLRLAGRRGSSSLHTSQPQTSLSAPGGAPALQYVDLTISRLSVEGDAVKALVTNKGRTHFSGTVDFALNVNGENIFGYGGTPEGIPLNIAPGGNQQVTLPCLMHTFPADKTGRIWLKATVDITNKVAELSETNNTRESSFPWGVSLIEVRVEKSHYDVDCSAGGYVKPKITVRVSTNAACTVKFVVNRGEGPHPQPGGGFKVENLGPVTMTFTGPGSQTQVLPDTMAWYPIVEREPGRPVTWYVNAEVIFPAIHMKSRYATFTTSCSH